MAEWELIGKIGGGSVEVQEWYYDHLKTGNIPTDKENPVLVKVEEATPEEPAIVVITTNIRNQQQHNRPWEEIVGAQNGDRWISQGKRKYAFFVTEPGELSLTSFRGYEGSGLYHTRAYIYRLSDYAPI